MKYIYSLTLDELLMMGNSTFVLGSSYSLVTKYCSHIIVEVSDSPIEVIDHYSRVDEWDRTDYEYYVSITVEGWSFDDYLSDTLKKSIESEIRLAEATERCEFLQELQSVAGRIREKPKVISKYDAISRYYLPDLSEHIIMQMVNSKNTAFFISRAAQLWIASGNPIMYLNFISADSAAGEWQDTAFKDAAFVALLPEVKDLPNSAYGLGQQAEILYRRARGRDAAGGRPLHHLTRFVSNVQEREDAYAVNPLGPGVQALLMGKGSDLDLDQLPMCMSLTLPQGRPVLDLSFRPIAAFTPEALVTHATAVNVLLEDFYVRVSETLAFFEDLGQLVRADARLIDQCPVFCFELTGHPAPSVPYADDELLQTHLLLNLGETFTQRRLLKKLHGLLVA